MSSLSRKFRTDKSLEVQGVELDYGDGVIITVARAGGANKRFLKEGQRIYKKYRRQIQLGILDEAIQTKLAHELYAKAVVLRWQGVTAEDIGREGEEPVDLTVENCTALFENLPDLWLDLQTQAQNAEIFKEHIREADAKN